MVQPRVLILRAPGTNCDGETAHAFSLSGGRTEVLHINRLLEQPSLCNQHQILCIPGGFSFGDDIASGRIFANLIRHHLADAMREFRAAGKLILGICNGFQVLINSGILLEDDRRHGPPATLAWNRSGRFEDRWVQLKTDGSKCVFLAGIDSMYLPIAHGEGRFAARSPDVLDDLDHAGQLVLRYTASDPSRVRQVRADAPPQDPATSTTSVLKAPQTLVPYPENPNGAERDVAGVCDPTGRIFGLMPHPERHVDPSQHPRWTRGEARTPGDGLRVFANAVAYFR
ncbi:MAG TPA: phosphoribosylformylglycinamidine synthase subunit PurQ [Pirellulales bacterium]|jgi:phosphoribosylformylglycinamidine synthase|nr:phosphoribosylformylglycinamidine synthase subunit PurQ [Pirellulales bacterium]